MTVRPNQRSFVQFADRVEAAYQPLLSAAAAATGADLLVEVDETNAASLALFDGLGACRTGGMVELVRPAVPPR